mgnify:CR=1 FL=1
MNKILANCISLGIGLGAIGVAFQAQAASFQGLGGLPGSFSSSATGVSADGSVVVGSSTRTPMWTTEAFRWTQATGMVGLGDLPGGSFYSDANGVSADGSVVVGISNIGNGSEAFRWTQATGMVGLGVLPGGYFSSSALGVSADGSVVVGYSDSENEAFIWNSTQGMRSLKQVLTNDYGLNLNGWDLTSANAISADGLTIVGFGTNPLGQSEAWIARLDGEPVPPGTTPTNPLLPTPNPSNPDGFIFSGVIVGNNGFGTTNPIYFDPVVSVGYDYSVTGGPLFASVLVPDALPRGDSNFILELPGFGNYSLVAGTTFNLLGVNPLGFSDFRISDIDPAEMLDPTNPTAFVTGLTFTAAGTVTVTQNPIIQNTGGVSVPEPSNLLGLGLLGFGAFFTGKLNKKQAKKDS